jgi:hypothetical protein
MEPAFRTAIIRPIMALTVRQETAGRCHLAVLFGGAVLYAIFIARTAFAYKATSSARCSTMR